jgi:hypothetical protein
MIIEPVPEPPRHQCVNLDCGCNDLNSAGTCSEWCAANTVELADVEKGKAAVTGLCECLHITCIENPVVRGTPERGPA